jgi:hypothetical protein
MYTDPQFLILIVNGPVCFPMMPHAQGSVRAGMHSVDSYRSSTISRRKSGAWFEDLSFHLVAPDAVRR